jgi:hypothetical protein
MAHVRDAAQAEQPVRVGGEPVVVSSIEDDRVVGADAASTQQIGERLRGDEVPPGQRMELMLPVQRDRAGDVALGDRRCVASTLSNLGLVALHRAEVDEASEFFARAWRCAVNSAIRPG